MKKIFTKRMFIYLILILVVVFEVPLHEGLHAVFAKLLPGVSCNGVAINSDYWYARPFQLLTFGFYQSEELPPGKGGDAKLIVNQSFIGRISSAIASIVPELITLLLGMFLLMTAVTKIKTAGQRLFAIFCAYAAMPLIANVYYYLKISSLSPKEGEDYFNFTKSLIQAVHLPGQLAYVLTFVSGALMVGLALYIVSFKKIK